MALVALPADQLRVYIVSDNNFNPSQVRVCVYVCVCVCVCLSALHLSLSSPPPPAPSLAPLSHLLTVTHTHTPQPPPTHHLPFPSFFSTSFSHAPCTKQRTIIHSFVMDLAELDKLPPSRCTPISRDTVSSDDGGGEAGGGRQAVLMLTGLVAGVGLIALGVYTVTKLGAMRALRYQDTRTLPETAANGLEAPEAGWQMMIVRCDRPNTPEAGPNTPFASAPPRRTRSSDLPTEEL